METPTQKLPADERRAVTVEAVVDLAAKQNPSEISTTAIAERMKLTQGALFRHFPSKDAIWEAVMGWVADKLLARIDEATARTPTALGALEAAFMAHVSFVAEHPGVPRIMFAELQRAGDTSAKRMVRALMGHYGERVGRLIDAGKAKGEIARDVDTAAAATLFLGAIQGLVIQSLIRGSTKRLRADAPGSFVLFSRAIRRSA
jgi:AcrR family transcriptional regulator